MKFGCSLEMVNMRTSGPNFIIKQSKGFWVEMFKLVAAAGFTGIELPYNPYSSDPVAFEIGRCGMPVSRAAVNAKYGSASSFLYLLQDIGIEEVTSLHISAQDIILELLALEKDCTKVPEMLGELGEEALTFLVDIGGKGLVISPTPEVGLLVQHMGKGDETWKRTYLERTTESLNRVGKSAAAQGVRVAVTNEFWSLVRGNQIEGFMAGLNSENIGYAPDPAHLAIADTDPVAMVRTFGDRLDFVRFTDTSFVDREKNHERANAEVPVQGAQRVFCDIGEGTVDVTAVYHVLQESGYDGWVVCESKKTLNVYRALLKMRWYLDHVIVKS
jgi:sugar phosphate isomerase/epimerase